MKKAIVTGGTGAIGIALIEELIKDKISVTVVCHENSERINRIPKSSYVDVIECNMERIQELPKYTGTGYDVFYHLAWSKTFGSGRNDVSAQISNIQYTLDAVETAAKLGCRRFVGAGSQAEYGRSEERLNAHTPTFPENGYGIAKLCAGQLSRIRCEQLSLEHLWIRILSVYGPNDGENTMIMELISKLLQGERPMCTKGEQQWDYLYAKDAGRALRLLGDKGQDRKIYCLGSGSAKPLKDYIELIRTMIDDTLEVGYGEIPYGERQVMHLNADISDIMTDTGFQPRYTFEEGIKETIDWVRKEMSDTSRVSPIQYDKRESGGRNDE